MKLGIAFDLLIDDMSGFPLPRLLAIGKGSVTGAHHDTGP